MDSSVERIDFLWVQFADHFGKFFVDVVLKHVVFQFWWFLNIVFHGSEDLQNELEGFLVDVLDSDLG